MGSRHDRRRLQQVNHRLLTVARLWTLFACAVIGAFAIGLHMAGADIILSIPTVWLIGELLR
jgi:hypothetical protein